MKNLKQRLLKGSLILAAAVVLSAVVFFILAASGAISANPFKIGFAIFALGIGAIFMIYALVTKGGYELGVGLILLVIGLIAVLIGVLKWYFILVIALATLALGFLALMILKSDKLIQKTTDEDPNFKPYSQILEEKKAQDAIKDAEPLPELKDYSKKD